MHSKSVFSLAKPTPADACLDPQLGKERDFFRISAPMAMIMAVGDAGGHEMAGRKVVLDLQRRGRPVRALVIDGESTPVIAFPRATQTLVHLAVNPLVVGAGGRDRIGLLIPRRSFDEVADNLGAPRLSNLNVEAGVAAGDTLMRNLGAGLDQALHLGGPGAGATIDRIGEALNLHIAQRYGGLRSRRYAAGGLAPWQLRLARHTLDHNLDGSMALEDLANRCGLSTSRFSRAFAKSTGLAPHRWLTQRRVEVAKEMITSDSMPLAHVAVACGFSDQSHFTRTFAALTGLTPGRWRSSQRQAKAEQD